MQHTLIIRCDGSSSIGMGHIYRCLELADELSKKYNYNIIFAVRQSQQGIQFIRSKKFDVIVANEEGFNYELWLSEIIDNHDVKAIIFDSRDHLDKQILISLKKKNIVFVSNDDNEEKRLACDLVFYPPIPQVLEYGWESFKGEKYIGWEYVIIRKEFCVEYDKNNSVARQLLISMGGSDPFGFTLRILKILSGIENNYTVKVVIGPAYTTKSLFYDFQKQNKFFEIIEDPENLALIMSQSDLAIASFGVTAYELACMKIPAAYLCISEDHAKSASLFSENGCAISLGIHDKVTDTEISMKLKEFLKNTSLRNQMKLNCSKIKLGSGTSVIAGIINNKLDGKY